MTAARRDHVHALPAGLVTNGDSHDHNGGDGAQIAYSSLSGLPSVREKLTADRTYYVRTDGNDSNTGLADTAGGAFLTIQKAVDVVKSAIDTAGFTVTIQLQAATHTLGAQLKFESYNFGSLRIQGDSASPGSYIIALGADKNILISSATGVEFYGCKISSGVSLNMVYILDGSVAFSDCIFSPNGGDIVDADHKGNVDFYDAITLEGNYGKFLDLKNSSNAFLGWCSLVANGPSAIGNVFVELRRDSALIVDTTTVTVNGSVTGKRYDVTGASRAIVPSGSTTYFPGDVAGTTDASSIYA
jgi:hypothetical protein